MADPQKKPFTIPGIGVPHPDEDFAANPVELFFDLAFVFAFAQLVGKLVEDPSVESLAQTLLLFVLLWLPWSQYTWSANATSGNARPVQLILLTATAISVPMAASVQEAFGSGGFTFGASLAVIYTMGLGLLVIGYDTGSPEWRSALRWTAPNLGAALLLVGGGLVETPLRTGMWVAAFLTFVWATIRAGDGDWVVRPGHFAERHGLIIIVALGEVIVAIAIPVLSSLEDGAGVPTQVLGALTAAGVFAGLLWWGYFDRPQRGLEHHARSLTGRDRGLFARDAYTYLHAPITAGIVLSAAALEEITLHPGVLPVEYRWMMFIGLAMYLGGIEGAAYRALRTLPPERFLAMIAIAVLVFTVGAIDGLWLVIAVDAVMLVTLVVEYLRVERRPMVAGGAGG